jgi:flagellar basal-body rod modification protein FlgD
MASIGTLLPTSTSSLAGISATSSSKTTTAAAGTSSADPTNDLGNEQTFLKLLVAQLQNQDPTQPADGMQFVTQLAQFSSVEQSLKMRSDLDSIEQKYVGATASTNSSSTDAAASGTGSVATSVPTSSNSAGSQLF